MWSEVQEESDKNCEDYHQIGIDKFGNNLGVEVGEYLCEHHAQVLERRRTEYNKSGHDKHKRDEHVEHHGYGISFNPSRRLE
jgi:hypothetical protein